MTSAHRRGSALLTSIIFIAITLVITSALLLYASYSHRRAIFASRSETEASCAESGMQIARSFFSAPAQAGAWNAFLANPSIYNPVPASFNPTPALSTGLGPILASHPELLFDLDGDSKPDVYIFIRDNADEIGAQVYTTDIDQTVYVGAVCMSQTMVPRRVRDGVAMSAVSPLLTEGLLTLNTSNGGCQYGSQHAGCGSANQNSAATNLTP